MTHLPRRLLGIGVLLAVTVIYDTGNTSLLHRLYIPAAMALGAWLVVQNLAAVLMAVVVIAATRTDFASTEILLSRIYPSVAALAGCGLAAIGLLRFQTRIAETREARWRNRNADEQSSR